MKSNTGSSKLANSRGRRSADKRNYPSFNALGSIKLYKRQDFVLSHYGLNYPGLRDLLTICHTFKNTGEGISPYTILKVFGKSHGTVRCMYDRLSYLKSIGLVKCIDRKYYPTETAIKEISDLLRSAS